MRIYNSLTRSIETFMPREGSAVGMYTCGPTVYDYVTIGNWRTYLLGDLLVRSLKYLGYQVDYVMNITDVGHLTGDNLGDADTGDDRMEKAVRREGKTAWEIADYYTQDFLLGYEKLNLSMPRVFCRATEHISEQIEMIEKIQTSGYTYRIGDGLYFDTRRYEADGYRYGQLSTLDQARERARVEPNPEKKDPRDFALWKFSGPNIPEASANQRKGRERWEFPERQMNWWFEGVDKGRVVTRENWQRAVEQGKGEWLASIGFPGWHIECSAMSCKYLGEQFDLHVGGEDLRSTHHPNEIAQAEAATKKIPFVKYWVHGSFLTVDGGRMGKSLGNAYTLADLEKQGYDVLALRYLYLTGHYRKQLNFTWDNLAAASVALERLRNRFRSLKRPKRKVEFDRKEVKQAHAYRVKFAAELQDDLNVPKALAVVWDALKDEALPEEAKARLLLDFDKVLGLDIHKQVRGERGEVPGELRKLVEERENVRLGGDYAQADRIRKEIEAMGYELIDTVKGTLLRKSKQKQEG